MGVTIIETGCRSLCICSATVYYKNELGYELALVEDMPSSTSGSDSSSSMTIKMESAEERVSSVTVASSFHSSSVEGDLEADAVSWAALAEVFWVYFSFNSPNQNETVRTRASRKKSFAKRSAFVKAALRPFHIGDTLLVNHPSFRRPSRITRTLVLALKHVKCRKTGSECKPTSTLRAPRCCCGRGAPDHLWFVAGGLRV